MSLDSSDNWGASRAQASQKLFEDLRSTRQTGPPPRIVQPQVPAGLPHAGASTGKRKADDAPPSSQQALATKKPKTQWTGWPLSIISSNSVSRGNVPSSTAPAMIDLTGGERPSPRLPPTSRPIAPRSQILHKQSQLSFEGSWSNVPLWPASQQGRDSFAAPVASARSSPVAVPAESSPGTQAMQGHPPPAKINEGDYHVVRVGWFPGIYASKTEANRQTKNYPFKEQQQFVLRKDAIEWLDAASPRKKKDAETRPKSYGSLNKEQFMSFLTRTWAKQNQLRDVDTEEIVEKVQFLFRQACESTTFDVDWNLQPLPQILVSQEKEGAKKTSSRWKKLGLWSGALKPQGAGGVKRPAAALVAVKPASTAPERAPIRVSHAEKVGMCSCKQPVTSDDDFVFCAGEQCAVLTYHKRCVGLSSRKQTEGWRCYPCRPKPPPNALAPSQRIALSSPQSRSSPPLIDFIPHTAPKTATHGEAEPPLHEEQLVVVDAIASGSNVFYTGSAGTGKSTVLKAFVQRLKNQGKHVDIVAPSGIAALNVGGMTIYAYAGWHPDSFKEGVHEIKKHSWNKKVHKRLCQTDVLVIDEISMVECDLLERLDIMMREARAGWRPEKGQVKQSSHGHSFPFGGAQVVVTGDFCQLPPVKPFRYCMYCGKDELKGHNMQDGRPLTCHMCKRVYKDEDKWAFCATAWKACKFRCYELKHIHRQSDRVFIDILQKVRYGQPLTRQDQALLLTHEPDPVGAVKLLPRRAEVDAENSRNFRILTSTSRTYDCQDCFIWRNKDEPELQAKGTPKYPNRPDGPLKALNDHRFAEQIELKTGMLVILLVNLDYTTGLVNGSQGKIIGFEQHDRNKVFPPKPAKEISKHRDEDVASEAARSDREALMEQQLVEFIDRNRITQWPVIEFQNGVIQPIYACCQLSEFGVEKPYSQLGRTQMPLLAAWAITVHKSQGMTLNRVIVDLYNSFEREMVYVALSRARNLEGLKVVRLAKSVEKGGINEQVLGFLRSCGLGCV